MEILFISFPSIVDENHNKNSQYFLFFLHLQKSNVVFELYKVSQMSKIYISGEDFFDIFISYILCMKF